VPHNARTAGSGRQGLQPLSPVINHNLNQAK
jgi:hypothetical protein